jgi:plasmid stabilization system protein ParE
VEYEVIIARSALGDLEQIRSYIARDNPSGAEIFCQKLLDACKSLRSFPERGGLIAERPGTRFVLVHRYLIVYRIDEHLAQRPRLAVLAWSARTHKDAPID